MIPIGLIIGAAIFVVVQEEPGQEWTTSWECSEWEESGFNNVSKSEIHVYNSQVNDLEDESLYASAEFDQETATLTLRNHSHLGRTAYYTTENISGMDLSGNISRAEYRLDTCTKYTKIKTPQGDAGSR